MWTAAAEAPITPDSQTAIILAVIGLLTAVVVAVVTGVFSLRSTRANRTEPAPPSPVPASADVGGLVGHLRERTAVLERRADDSDERDEVQDRRLDQLERILDVDNPEWRHDGH